MFYFRVLPAIGRKTGFVKNQMPESVRLDSGFGMMESVDSFRVKTSVNQPVNKIKFAGKVKLQKNIMLQISDQLNQDILTVSKNGSGEHVLTDKNNSDFKATAKQPDNDPNQIEMFLGKGGFTAIVTSEKGTKYFLLPGTEFKLGQTEVKINGQPIQPASRTINQASNQAAQTVTPQAMILGAGLATRFEPVSGENTGYSKPAVPILGKDSVIGLIAKQLEKNGFNQLFINTFFKPKSLKASLAQYNVSYVDENAPSGTAGGLRKILQNPDKYGFDTTKPLMLVQGDSVTDVNFSELMNAHVNNNALVTIGCQTIRDEDVNKFGIVETNQSDADGVSGNITSFVEKPEPHETTSRLGNTGFYIFSPESYPIILDVFKEMGEAGEKELDYAKNIFPKVLERAKQLGKPFWAQKVDGYWSDIGNPTQYLEAVHNIYAGKTSLTLPENKTDYFENGIVYWPGAKNRCNEEGTVLSGNAIVALPVES